MILSHPTTAPTLSVTLRNPIMGNSATVPLKTNLHLTMSGLAVTTKRTVGYERLLLTITTICDPTDLIAFIRAVKGDDFRLAFDSDEWIGKLLNNPTELTHELKNSHNVTLEFQGVKQ